jgi:hypothetical protein
VRRIAIAAAAVVVGGLGFFALAPSANADPSVCIELHLNLNGTPVDVSECLPGDEAPGLPPLPA